MSTILNTTDWCNAMDRWRHVSEPHKDAAWAPLRAHDDELRIQLTKTERERDAAIAECRKRKDIEQEAAAAREEARRLGELLMDGRTAVMLALDDVPGWTGAAIAWLARWPEVKL